MWSRSELKGNARRVLADTYGKMLIISLLFTLLAGASFKVTVKPGFFIKIAGLSTVEDLLEEEFWQENFHSEDFHIGGFHIDDFHINDFIEDFPWAHGFRMVAIFAGMLAMYGALVRAIIQIFLREPVDVSIKRFLLFNRSGARAEFKELIYAFRYSYLNIVKIEFLRLLYTFLWSLLFWIPGIVKSYEYRMIPYLLAENPNLTREEAFSMSKRMMDGEKWNVFVLDCSFIGYWLLSLFTFGLLNLFYVTPYKLLTDAELYTVLKGKVTIGQTMG